MSRLKNRNYRLLPASKNIFNIFGKIVILKLLFSIKTYCAHFYTTIRLSRQYKRKQHGCIIVPANPEYFCKTIIICILFLKSFLEQLNKQLFDT